VRVNTLHICECVRARSCVLGEGDFCFSKLFCTSTLMLSGSSFSFFRLDGMLYRMCCLISLCYLLWHTMDILQQQCVLALELVTSCLAQSWLKLAWEMVDYVHQEDSAEYVWVSLIIAHSDITYVTVINVFRQERTILCLVCLILRRHVVYNKICNWIYETLDSNCVNNNLQGMHFFLYFIINS
jgi:hypothetical protein